MTFQAGQFATRSLLQSPRGEDICRILAEAVNCSDAGEAVRKSVSRTGNQLTVGGKQLDMERYARIFVIGAGKAVVPMAGALQDMLDERITAGVVITKKEYPGLLAQDDRLPITVLEASHPIPDKSNLEGSARVTSLVHNLHPDDLVLCLISGGGSALLMEPAAGISLGDLQLTTQLLLACGAEIGEINTIRKHLDELKGGRLAKIIHPAALISLIISDVVSDDLSQVASGPTVADPTTYHDAWTVLEKYQLADKIPSAVRAHIQDGISGKLAETPKPGDPLLEHVQNIIIASNTQVVLAAEQSARAAGFETTVLDDALHGEASQVGRQLVEKAKSMLATRAVGSKPACFIAGGETTVTLHGHGMGGRNQELALGAVESLSGDQPMILVSLATDGQDGPTDAAGAVATNETYQYSQLSGLEPGTFLASNDAYHYFEHLGDLVKTGPTLTNVNDLVLLFAW